MWGKFSECGYLLNRHINPWLCMRNSFKERPFWLVICLSNSIDEQGVSAFLISYILLLYYPISRLPVYISLLYFICQWNIAGPLFQLLPLMTTMNTYGSGTWQWKLFKVCFHKQHLKSENCLLLNVCQKVCISAITLSFLSIKLVKHITKNKHRLYSVKLNLSYISSNSVLFEKSIPEVKDR